MRTTQKAALAALAASAAAGSVLNGLPNCWDKCSNFVAGEDCSWYDAGCICDLANNSNYLSATITCAEQTCKDNWDPSDVGRFLAPIEFTCSLEGGVSPDALAGASSAVAQATTATTPSQTTTTAAKTTQAAETTLQATITQSSSTAVVDQPVSFGSSGLGFSSGAQSTSVVVSTIEIVPVPVSSAGSSQAGTTTAGGIVQQTGSLTSTPEFQPSSTTSSSTHAKTSPTSDNGGGGSPFDSTGDGSSNSVAGIVIAAYVVAVALIHAL